MNPIISLMAKQADFAADRKHEEILFSGAWGAGKTRALCVRAVLLAQHPAAVVGLCRKFSANLRATTLRTLLEPDGDLEAVLPPGSYKQNKMEGRIDIYGSGTIMYFGCDDPSAVASRSLTDVCIDEGAQLERAEYEMLLGRIRVTYTMQDGTKNTNTLAIATNPDAPTHFLYKRFFEQQDPRRLVIETSTAENRYLPEEYQKRISELHGTALRRYYHGEWIGFSPEELVIPDMTGCIIERLPFNPLHAQTHERVGGIDHGYHDPTVIITGFYVEFHLYISEVYNQTEATAPDHATAIRTGHTYFRDPSAAAGGADIARAVNDCGGRARIVAAVRRKEVEHGQKDFLEHEWAMFATMIQQGRLHILRGQEAHLLTESRAFRWDERTGKPSKTRRPGTWYHFDTLDALRYLIMSVDRQRYRQGFAAQTSPERREPTRHEMMRAY